MRRATLLAACLAGALPALGAGTAVAQDAGAAGRWYAGAGAGVARLTPDTDASTLSLEEDTATAFGLWFGRDLTRRFAVEGSLASLGDAGLSNGATIGYRVASAGVLAHVLGARSTIAPSLYLRAGLGFIDNESDLELEQADDLSVWAAAGAQWPFARRWAVRGEVASYDGDAQAGFLTLFRRFGAAGPPVRIADAGRADRATEESVAAAADPEPVAVPTPAPRTPSRRAPVIVPFDAPSSGSIDCAAPAPNEPVDARGCARFSGVLAGVDFAVGTATPTASAARLLERTGTALAASPGLTVEIRAHTDGALGRAGAQALSRERAVAVARALAGAGVDVSRLRARAFGASVPRASDGGPGGARPNDRIELRILP